MESPLKVWHAFSTLAEGDALVVTLNKLVSKTVGVTYKEYAGLKCIVTGFDLSLLRATRGSIITGSTPAAFRLEATIKLEHTP